MAVTPFNSDLTSALKYVTEQIPGGTLSAETKPSLTTATAIWNEQFGDVAERLITNGISGNPSDYTSESAALLWVQKTEAYLTGGNVLLELGSAARRPMGQSGSSGDSTADRLLKMGNARLDRLDTDRRLRLFLIGNGGASASLPTSGFASSDWTDGRDTTIDVSYGGANVGYVPAVPTIQDGEPL